MKKVSTLAVALALAFVGTTALADDNSMSRFGGESYAAFDAAMPHGSVTLAAESRTLLPHDDNSMSPWNGDSYKAFEEARIANAARTIAEAPKAKLDRKIDERPHVARLPRGPMPVNPFKDDTA